MSALAMDTQNTNETPDIVASELGDNCAAFYHRGHNAESVAEYNYKIRDDSAHPREFFGTDSEDGIESILTDRIGHSLHDLSMEMTRFTLLLISIYHKRH